MRLIAMFIVLLVLALVATPAEAWTLRLEPIIFPCFGVITLDAWPALGETRIAGTEPGCAHPSAGTHMVYGTAAVQPDGQWRLILAIVRYRYEIDFGAGTLRPAGIVLVTVSGLLNPATMRGAWTDSRGDSGLLTLIP